MTFSVGIYLYLYDDDDDGGDDGDGDDDVCEDEMCVVCCSERICGCVF